MRVRSAAASVAALITIGVLTGCGSTGGGTAGTPDSNKDNLSVEVGSDLTGKTICFGFSGSETEFWAAGIKSIEDSLRKVNATVVEHDSNEDPNKQLEQIHDCITQGVDGIIIIPQDGSSAVTIIGEANQANIPIAIFNRPPASDEGDALVAVADNRGISKSAVEYLADQAKKLGKKAQPLIMVGDLGDPNAVERRKGFYDVIDANPDLFKKPIEVQTNWDAATGKANLQAALQANPNIDLIFTSSDFLYPQIRAVLSPLGKWAKSGEAGHVIMGGVDGDHRACGLLKDGYVDATGVQDVFYEAKSVLTNIATAINNKDTKPDKQLVDPGFVLTQSNVGDKGNDDWGCVITPPGS